MDNNLIISQDTELFMNKPLTNIEDEYITEHEAKMYHVLDELLYTTNNVYCGNDMCEKEICKHDSIEDEFMDINYYFCDNNYCHSYGMWSLRYDYRKSMRRKR